MKKPFSKIKFENGFLVTKIQKTDLASRLYNRLKF